MPQTITVHLAEGYESQVEYNSIGECRAKLQLIGTELTSCKTNDDAEAKAGVEIAACENQDELYSQANELKTAADNALTAIWNTFTTHFEPKSQTIQNLVDRGKNWSKVGLQLDQIQGHVQQHLMLDEWSSKGAQEYKNALPKQQNALNELEELCYRQQQVCSSGAAINAGIFAATYTSFVQVLAAIKNKNSSFSGFAPGRGGYSATYYTRTANAKAQLESLKTWIETIVTTRGDWSNSAQMVADDIPTVQSSVANLEAGGVWPDPKSANAADANVDDQTSSTGRGNASSGTTGSGSGINL
ncbi:hypothetical protein ACQB6R_05755 [Propionibacteriaceae bacterium G1746]|uniref:hypothetical protein n=1 Tax=Aestuariimicrobium sp. G57 TaxID=3418485 RepID=UPI003C1EFAFA